MTPDEWVHQYALLALRIDKLVLGSATGTVVIFSGPPEWRAEVAGEEPAAAGKLVDDADALLDTLPFPAERARYLAAQVRAMRVVARQLNGEQLPLSVYAGECLGVTAEVLPTEVFEEAHDLLDRALPKGAGSLLERLRAWQAFHTLPPDQVDRIPGLVDRAVAETRRRTNEIVPLPADEVTRCELVSGVNFRAAGAYDGDLRSTIHLNTDLPFNLADLLYVVAHEGHPGHIAESMLKDLRLVGELGFLDQQVRFMLSPSFVISEGLGLHAQDIAFPDGRAQAWLRDNVLAEQGIAPDGSDFAAIHRAQNALFGAWGNAAFLADEGRPDAEISAYLTRWALVPEAETGAVLSTLRAGGMSAYVLGYFHGWRLLDRWLAAPDRDARVRRLLTEQLLPADLAG
ncbi:hypothetical protein ABT337_24755 [Saccharopolyspora hirsuta]|uniref:DUF885 domain-containing protein n=1 Tax=Saccharopolyspora hirsuta TaxID=1837 RepID=A0A5M7B8Z9_SACHI|nr:hypothetical protein [Saccharopolyspora hirsuta]KAA5825852.1 hypothetical protein F1721_32360 [Saccharopolyspora hirsuta]